MRKEAVSENGARIERCRLDKGKRERKRAEVAWSGRITSLISPQQTPSRDGRLLPGWHGPLRGGCSPVSRRVTTRFVQAPLDCRRPRRRRMQGHACFRVACA